jgi:U4/U6 small nuclear ribonucleoprotein PRP4
VSGDAHGIGLVWDLRSGRSILQLQGHVMQILTLKFSPNCYQIATGSDDNTIKLWDLRKKGCVYTIPAHNQPISDIQWEQSDNKFLVSCSYDGTFKLWNNRDWSMIKCYMNLNDSKLTSIGITKDNKTILTSSMDRTVKKWSNTFENTNPISNENHMEIEEVK